MVTIHVKKPRAAKKPAKKASAAQLSAAKARKTALSKYDWDGARERFISAEVQPSLKDLAAEMNIPYQQLRTRSSNERWPYLRAEEQRKIFKQKRATHLADMADQSIKFDKSTIDTAKLGMGLIAGRLAEIAAQFAAAQPASRAVIQKMQRGLPVSREELYSVVNYKELGELSRAGLAFQQMGRAAFGTDVQNFNFETNEGSSIEAVINVGAELGKDDPDRLAAMMAAMERANLIQLTLDGEEEEDEDIVDAEIVDDETKALEAPGGNSDAQDQ
jgi:hypothetical protein